MRILWLCNRMPGAVRAHITGGAGDGLWTDHVLKDLRQLGCRIHILSRGGSQRGCLDSGCSYSLFPEAPPEKQDTALEAFMAREVQAFAPDVIHIWGTEYGHTLAMVNACEKLGLLDRVAVSIQGLCSEIARHYCEGIPYGVCRGFTLRDLLRQDNLFQQQRTFARRGALEVAALKKVLHIIGRTQWDRACTYGINPKAAYHHCDETLRDVFYEDSWSYSACQKHRIFASSCVFPFKGFHYLLEALAELVKEYPDAVLAVTGKSFLLGGSWKEKLRESSYPKYLARLVRQYGLENHVEFLGGLSAEAMKAEYLKAHVFALPSAIENSPNSLGEAMLLGVPCVAADVGGVTTLMTHEQQGFVYQSTAPRMLAHSIRSVLQLQKQAEQLGCNAQRRAAATHDPRKNLEALLAIYQEVAAH